MSTHTKTPKLVLQLSMAVRLASQEMNLISAYNKLKGKKFESPTAIRGYTKGDDRVPVFGQHEYFVSVHNRLTVVADHAGSQSATALIESGENEQLQILASRKSTLRTTHRIQALTMRLHDIIDSSSHSSTTIARPSFA